MIRPILSLRRLSLDEAQGQVIYQYGKHSGETEHMDYLEFVARVTSHIPDKGQVMIRSASTLMRIGEKRRKRELTLPAPLLLKMKHYLSPLKAGRR